MFQQRLGWSEGSGVIYPKFWKGKKPPAKDSLLGKTITENSRGDKELAKQKLKEFTATKRASQGIFKEASLSRKGHN